jgi:hypothetical protein
VNFYVYAIRDISGKRIYIGQCGNFEKRLVEHNKGCVKSTKAHSRGYWLHFKLSKAALRLVGSSTSSRDREEKESAGFGIMRLPLTHCYRATPQREGASRESKKDYLHFLYIARGSLSETQYFIHLARRLDYLSVEEADALREQTKVAFACLHGLIRAVEKEAASGSVESTAQRGKLSKVVATVTSLIVIGLMRWSGSQLSVVS